MLINDELVQVLGLNNFRPARRNAGAGGVVPPGETAVATRPRRPRTQKNLRRRYAAHVEGREGRETRLIHVSYRTARVQACTEQRCPERCYLSIRDGEAWQCPLHCHLHCQPLSLSGLARPQSTSTAWDRLVSTFSSSRSSDLRPRVALWLPRRV